MSTTATNTRKPNIGQDPTKGSRVRWWQVGIYAFAIGITVALVAVCVSYLLAGKLPRLFIGLTAFVGGLSWMLLTAKNGESDAPKGTDVTNVEPRLAAFVQAVADRTGAPMPKAIFLVADAQLALTESTRFFGRKVESSRLTVGLPYLHALTRREFAAVLAHEFGHYGDLGVDEGVRAIRSLRAARDLISVEREGFVNGVYGSYARKMFRSVGGVGVAQEERAELAAVEAYGTDALLSALAKLDDVSVGFDQMLRAYVVPALQHQSHPLELFAGFEQFMASPVRAEQRARDLERHMTKDRSEFELHRTPFERAAFVEALPFETGAVAVEAGNSGAHTLLEPDAKSTEITVASWASGLMGSLTQPRTWQELAEDVYAAKAQSVATLVFDCGPDPQVHFERAIAWSEADAWGAVDTAIAKPLKSIRDPLDRRRKWARAVAVEAAAATGKFGWQHNWDGFPRLVGPDGICFDAASVANALIDGEPDLARERFDAAVAASS